MKRLQSRSRQMIKAQDYARFFFDLAIAGNQTGARTPSQQRNARVHAEQLQDLGGVREKLWRHENDAERDSGSV